MPFQKGNTLGSKGAKVRAEKYRQWSDIGAYLTLRGSDKFLEELDKLDGKEYIAAFKDIMEYFKPKLARSEIDHTSKGEQIFVSDDHRKKAEEAISNFLEKK